MIRRINHHQKVLYARLAPLLLSTFRSRFFLWNMFGNIGPLIFALALMPYIYAHSTEEYVGFLTITWAAIGYTGLFDLGLSRALFFFAATSKADNRIGLEGAIIKSTLFAIAIAALVNVILYALQQHIAEVLRLNGRDQLHSLFVISLSLPVYLLSNMIRSSLEGLEMFKQANIFKFIAYISLFLCPATLIAFHDTRLSDVCTAYAGVRLIACLYALWALLPRLFAQRPVAADVRSIPFLRILGFGGWATVSSTISPLMVYGDRFALAYFNGASAIAIYALLQEFIGKTILFSASYVTSIQPRLGYLPEPEAADLYQREHKNIAILSIIIYSGCFLASPIGVAMWLNVRIADVAALAMTMSVGFMFNSMAQAPLAYLLARGHPRRIAGSHAIEALLYFPVLIIAVMRHGVLGAAIAGVLRQLFDYGILSWQARRPTA